MIHTFGRLDPTYEVLKLFHKDNKDRDGERLDPTYEVLKPVIWINELLGDVLA